MKKLLLTNANAAFALLGEYAGLYADNGGDPDGPAWLPSDQDDIPASVAQMVIDAGFGELADATVADDDEVCKFLDLALPSDDESGQDLKERVAARMEARSIMWAHYGAYNVGDSQWVYINV